MGSMRADPGIEHQPPLQDIRCSGTFDNRNSVHLWLIRHGESDNNVLMDRLYNMPSNDSVDREQKLRQFKNARAPDPALSNLGRKQVSLQGGNQTALT